MKADNIITYYIDGNNLIGKIPELKKIKDNSAREKLIYSLQRFFKDKKAKVIVFFDGFPSERINSSFEIVYSLNKKADEVIKKRIDGSFKNKNLIVVSSDLEIYSYSKICGCKAIKSEDFFDIMISSKIDINQEKPDRFNVEEYKKLFEL